MANSYIGTYKKKGVVIESTPYQSDRAMEILNAPYGDYMKLMADGEIEYTLQVWRTMPGYTCFYDAICRIYNNNLPSGTPDKIEVK